MVHFSRILILTILITFAAAKAQGQSTSHEGNSAPLPAASAPGYEYPELLVTPLASDRLERESKKNKASSISSFIPYQVSGFMTLVAALQVIRAANPLKEDEASRYYIGLSGIVIGGGWFAATTAMSFAYNPYASDLNEIRKMSKQSKRDSLARERAAEETLIDAGMFARRLSWMSLISNGAVGVAMVSASKEPLQRIAAGAALGGALLPVLFKHHWRATADAHEDYKKRIYGPLAAINPVLKINGTGLRSLGIGLNLTYSF